MNEQRDQNAHAQPPTHLRKIFKRWQKAGLGEISNSIEILDFSRSKPDAVYISDSARSDTSTATAEKNLYHEFCDTTSGSNLTFLENEFAARAIEVKSIPGLFIYPALLPPRVQVALMDRLLHRDLSNPAHQTNIHLHYHVTYPEPSTKPSNGSTTSFFDMQPDTLLNPIDPDVHKPLSIQQVLNKKLRWITLGGQYDWTRKVYPEEHPPPFPVDIANLLRGLFPDVDAQAAIVNFYSPGDTLSVHRDVSEMCDRGLISLSIGCDALFTIGTDLESQLVTIRLRSGDVLLMTEEARFAWHSVPKIIPNTCPTWLEDWPSLSGERRYWKSWMKTKRINLNVRQMKVV